MVKSNTAQTNLGGRNIARQCFSDNIMEGRQLKQYGYYNSKSRTFHFECEDYVLHLKSTLNYCFLYRIRKPIKAVLH